MFKDINNKLDELINKLESVLNEEELSLKELTSLSNSIGKLLQIKTNAVFKEKEFELKGGDVDFSNPRIQRAFYFLVEVFIFSMDEAGISEEMKKQVLDKLMFNLIGFEEKLNKSLKGVKLNMVDQIVNPLAKKIIDEAKNSK